MPPYKYGKKPDKKRKFLKTAGSLLVGLGIGGLAVYVNKRGKSKGNASVSQNQKPQRSIVLKEGETIGHLTVKYLGGYSQENLDKIRSLNKDLKDLDNVLAGTTVVLPDTRPEAKAPAKESSGKAESSVAASPKKGPVPASPKAEQPVVKAAVEEPASPAKPKGIFGDLFKK